MRRWFQYEPDRPDKGVTYGWAFMLPLWTAALAGIWLLVS